MSELKFSILNHQGYKEAEGKLTDLKGQYNEVDRYIATINSVDHENEFKSLKKKKVVAILNNEDPDDITQTDWRGAYSKACDRRRVLLAGPGEQKRVVQNPEGIAAKKEEKGMGKKKEAEGAKPLYSEIVRELADKMTELGRVIEREIEFRDVLKQGDVQYSGSFTPMNIASLGDPRDIYSRLAAWLIEAAQRGYLSEKNIPQEWRDVWFKRSGFVFEKKAAAPILERLKNTIAPKKPAGDEWTGAES